MEMNNFSAVIRTRANITFERAFRLYVSIGRGMEPGFTIDNDNRFVTENIVKWLIGDNSMRCTRYDTKENTAGRLDKGLYLCGPTGTGKTMALAVLSAFAGHIGATVTLGGKKEFLLWGSVHASRICESYTLTGNMDYARRKILCIQDLGAEPMESVYNGNRISTLGVLLSERGDNPARITIITSNYPISALSGRYSDRTASRIIGMCNYFELRGEDRRLSAWKG